MIADQLDIRIVNGLNSALKSALEQFVYHGISRVNGGPFYLEKQKVNLIRAHHSMCFFPFFLTKTAMSTGHLKGIYTFMVIPTAIIQFDVI